MEQNEYLTNSVIFQSLQPHVHHFETWKMGKCSNLLWMHVHMCLCVTHACVQVSVHMGMGVWSVGAFLDGSLFCVETRSFKEPRVHCARHWPGNPPVSTLPALRPRVQTTTPCFAHACWRSELRSSCCCSKDFTSTVISSAALLIPFFKLVQLWSWNKEKCIWFKVSTKMFISTNAKPSRNYFQVISVLFSIRITVFSQERSC